jgi:hypothetical protein
MVLNSLRQCTKILITMVFLVPLMAYSAPYFDEHAPPSYADYIPLSHAKDSLDKGWLPLLTGLPDEDQVALLTQYMLDTIKQEKDPKCTSINVHLRKIIFQHFLIYQHLVNAQHVYLDDKIAHQWAHVLAMILKESSGDSTSITDMNGDSISTYRSKTNLQQWQKIITLSNQGKVQMNSQTNFGLTQLSSDRLTDAFHLAKNQRYDTAFLEGKEGASTPGKIKLNTAIAIRRIIWFYQDFAQGRTSESESRIPKKDIYKPEFYERYQAGLNLALLYCGTGFMFRGKSFEDGGKKMSLLKKAMASIAYCKLGNSQAGYGVNEIDEKCFAEWVTLCPALNIDIATLTPLSYFETRGATPVCEGTFKQLITTKSNNKK